MWGAEQAARWGVSEGGRRAEQHWGTHSRQGSQALDDGQGTRGRSEQVCGLEQEQARRG